MNRLIALACKASALEEQLAASLRLVEQQRGPTLDEARAAGGMLVVEGAGMTNELERVSVHAQLARLLREGVPRG